MKHQCQALTSSYGSSIQCSRKSRWLIAEHELCDRHAQMLALETAINSKTATLVLDAVSKHRLAFVKGQP